MANRYNALSSHSIAVSRKIAADAGLCYQCGMPADRCLHVVVKNMMGEPEYSNWYATVEKGGRKEFDALAKKRYELTTAQALRQTRGKDEALRIETGRLQWPPERR